VTTRIVGDTASGLKYWSTAQWMKSEHKRIYGKTNPFMNVWRRIDADTVIHLKLLNGTPSAVIYVDGGYEFFVPFYGFVNDTIEDADVLNTLGVDFYEQSENHGRQLMLIKNARAIPPNTWYKVGGYVTTLSHSRYRNIHSTHGRSFPYASLSQARVISGNIAARYYSLLPYSAAACVGDYLIGMQPGNIDGKTFAFVEHIPSREVINASEITGSWPYDVFNPDLKNEYAHGYWTFNHDGTRACTVVWVLDSERFETVDELHDNQPYVGQVTSWLVELEFKFGDNNGQSVFQSVEVIKEVETNDFCIAADYDWTTPGNELVLAELSGFDYRFAKAYDWSPLSSGPDPETNQRWAAGDYLKTTLPAKTGDPTRVRPGEIYQINRISAANPGHPNNPPQMGDLPPVLRDNARFRNGDFLLDHITETSAMDVWLTISQYDGDILRQVELAHNIDYQNTAPSDGTWFEGEDTSSSFVVDVTGMDLRVRGLTLADPNSNAVEASLYHLTWRKGESIPSSGEAEPKPSNYYYPDKLYERIKFLEVPQTITAIPYLATDDGEIKSACVYAPAGDVRFPTNTEDAIDFRIDFLSDTKGKVIENYHSTIYSKFYQEPTYLGRMFISGGWLKAKYKP
jgi:hypothetical protein